jgi:hypothetical protein
MPKFQKLTPGENQELTDAIYKKVEDYIKELFHEDEIIKIR